MGITPRSASARDGKIRIDPGKFQPGNDTKADLLFYKREKPISLSLMIRLLKKARE
jgi:hypothetical protein